MVKHPFFVRHTRHRPSALEGCLSGCRHSQSTSGSKWWGGWYPGSSPGREADEKFILQMDFLPKRSKKWSFQDVRRCSKVFHLVCSWCFSWFSKTVLASHLQTSNHSQVFAPAPASVVKPQPSKSMRTTKFVGRILRISPRISGDFMEKPWGNLWEVKLISADKDEFRDLHPRADGSPMFSSSFMATVATVDYWASVCTSHHGIQLSTVPVPKSLHPSFTFWLRLVPFTLGGKWGVLLPRRMSWATSMGTNPKFHGNRNCSMTRICSNLLPECHVKIVLAWVSS